MVKRVTLKTYLENMGDNKNTLADKTMRFLLQWEEYSGEERDAIQRYIKQVLQTIANI